jgi:Na+/H+ antiporter NhaD/arsenite permease-like protein
MGSDMLDSGAVSAATGVSFDVGMGVSAIVLCLTFLAIFTEGVHKIDRTKVAMFGAGIMIFAGQIFGFYNPQKALEVVDWNVILLLGGMMTIIAIMIPTGGFQAVAYWIAQKSQGRKYALLVMMGTSVAVISMLLDNVTTIIIFGPLIVLICQALQISPIPSLLGAAILSNTGGVATLVGDPPNIMIGSAAGISFNEFFIHMGGLVFCVTLATLGALYVLFRREVQGRAELPEFSHESLISDPRTWYVSLGALVIMIVAFVSHHHLGWEAWVVAALGLTILLIAVPGINLDHTLDKIELSMLLFFLALFIVVGGVEHSRFLTWVAQMLVPLVQENLLVATVVILWVGAIISALINNIPFMAALIPMIQSMEADGVNVAPLWWALAAGVGLGGNGTHIGASANMVVLTLSERLAKSEGNPALAITPGLWIRKGMPIMLLTLVVSTAVIVLFFDFFAAPIRR